MAATQVRRSSRMAWWLRYPAVRYGAGNVEYQYPILNDAFSGKLIATTVQGFQICRVRDDPSESFGPRFAQKRALGPQCRRRKIAGLSTGLVLNDPTPHLPSRRYSF